MRIHTSKHIKLKLGKKYLEIAAMLPHFGGGFIRTLQDMKAHHNESAEEGHKRSRPPANVELDLLYFQLIEMFHLEDFDKLRDGLYRLLPALKDDSFYRFRFSCTAKHEGNLFSSAHCPHYVHRGNDERSLKRLGKLAKH